jgi:DNA-binding transcriptional LysR family regulator
VDRPDPNDLMMFAAVVRQGSFKKAGEQLGVPHSTISRRVMMLENRLGEKFLQRTTRTLTLTDLGATVLVHAEHVAAEVEATADLIQGRTSEPSGHLRLSMPTDFTSDMLGSLITRFMAQHPKISVDVDVSRRRVDLIAENFDLAVRIGDLQDDATLAARRVGTIDMGLYASPSYLEKRGVPDTPADLSSHDILHLTQRIGEPMRLRLVSDDKSWEGSPQARVTANSPGILMHMAVNGAGIAPLANHLAAECVRSGALVRVVGDWQQAEIPIWAIIPGRRLLPLRTQLFIDALKKEMSR